LTTAAAPASALQVEKRSKRGDWAVGYDITK